MFLLVDNYDSFTYNLAHLIGELDADIVVKRNDQISTSKAIEMAPRAIFISPGPKTPSEAGICMPLIRAAADQRVPVFGVCLGMQSIFEVFGGTVARAGRLMHGKTSAVAHDATGILNGIETPFQAARYHSLAAVRDTTPAELKVTAVADDDQEIMAIEHKSLPIAGVQFHPESIASNHGVRIIENFLAWSER